MYRLDRQTYLWIDGWIIDELVVREKFDEHRTSTVTDMNVHSQATRQQTFAKVMTMTFGNKYRLATWCVTLTPRPCQWLHAAHVRISDWCSHHGPAIQWCTFRSPNRAANKKSLGILYVRKWIDMDLCSSIFAVFNFHHISFWDVHMLRTRTISWARVAMERPSQTHSLCVVCEIFSHDCCLRRFTNARLL